ncbi:MAG TPA: gamma carbonic anhydrase family protein [Alphaproteobacteria bacterium]|nr:gamma carbonic anhydrase family protein [Rhodospirillaceae bacterium]HRJ12900.1 gamma carbonic anhydrase family protein [Alphaproteobacteria bacterium]
MSGNIISYKSILPRIADGVFVADTARVIGDVEIGAGCGIWFGAVIRGDVNAIRIGAMTNIQDNAVIHVASEAVMVDGRQKHGYPAIIGNGVTVGHMALIHACQIGDDCLIGMNSCVMDAAVVEAGSIVAAGALVTPGKRVPTGQLWAGSPARYVRDVTAEELADIKWSAEHYNQLMQNYL